MAYADNNIIIEEYILFNGPLVSCICINKKINTGKLSLTFLSLAISASLQQLFLAIFSIGTPSKLFDSIRIEGITQ